MEMCTLLLHGLILYITLSTLVLYQQITLTWCMMWRRPSQPQNLRLRNLLPHVHFVENYDTKKKTTTKETAILRSSDTNMNINEALVSLPDDPKCFVDKLTLIVKRMQPLYVWEFTAFLYCMVASTIDLQQVRSLITDSPVCSTFKMCN